MTTKQATRKDFLTGVELLDLWNCKTREERLERACKALMEQLEQLHTDYLSDSLKENLSNQRMFCSCMDAYRMGHEALK